MKVAIYSIEKTLFEGEAEKLIVETDGGQMTVLDHHIPIVTRIYGPTVYLIRREAERVTIPLEKGILEVRPESEVVVLASI